MELITTAGARTTNHTLNFVTFHFSPMPAVCPAHFVLDLIILIVFGEVTIFETPHFAPFPVSYFSKPLIYVTTR
jgi:hypothetical protein